jgi:hypothetical protein
LLHGRNPGDAAWQQRVALEATRMQPLLRARLWVVRSRLQTVEQRVTL